MSFIQIIAAAQADPRLLLLTGTDRWSISGSGTAANPYSGNSTNQSLNSTTATATFVTVGAGTLRWNIIVNSEIVDLCRLTIGGTTIFTIGGINVQRIGSQFVFNNTTIQVSYAKDTSVSAGTDTATINSLSVT